jgi:hypothetical protein
MRLPILILHVSAGIVGLLSGTAAMSFRKGSHWHRVAGNVFVAAMLTMGMCGSYMALVKHQTNNVFGGVLTVYLVSTAWLVGRRRAAETNFFDWAALLMALEIGGGLLTLGFRVANGLEEAQAGVPPGMYFFMGAVSLLAAAGDIRMLVNGGIFGRPRIVRHLWRMCFGWFIATGSFFLGQQQVFPEMVRTSNVLFVPALLPLLLLIFWVVRVRSSRAAAGPYVGAEGRAVD